MKPRIECSRAATSISRHGSFLVKLTRHFIQPWLELHLCARSRLDGEVRGHISGKLYLGLVLLGSIASPSQGLSRYHDEDTSVKA